MTNDTQNLISDAIAGADEICDPLEGLQKVAKDSAAAFTPAVLQSLAALKKYDLPAFEALRAQLKKAGCRVTVLDAAIAKESGDVGGRGPTQVDTLLKLAEVAEVFHTPDTTGWADVFINGHRETWAIRSNGFRSWLEFRYFQATQGAPSSEALQSALSVIAAKARYDGPERVVHVRVGGVSGKLYLDLGDETWRVVEIDDQGWRLIDTSPVRFRRAAGMRPLPIPIPGGSVEELRPFLNLKSDDDFVLVVGYLLASLRDCGPYPVLALSGEQGSAKSTFSKILKALLDPNTAPLRALPREQRDLSIAANNGHVLAFDNVSGLQQWISDALCRLSTGGGFAVRQNYTDQDEVLFDAVRPVILNGIEEIISKADLADRTVFLTLEPIPENKRRSERELWADFETTRPRILGALLDAVVRGLAMLPHTRLEKLPRMADFALWLVACETALWPAGTFMAAFRNNRAEAVESVLESDLVAVALRTFMAKRTEWTGSATELLRALGAEIGEPQNRSKEWPASAKALSSRLRRAMTFLRNVGVEIAFLREGRARARTIRISTTSENSGKGPSAPSGPSANRPTRDGSSGFEAHPTRTEVSVADDRADRTTVDSGLTVRANRLKSNEMNAADDADANLRPQSAQKKPDRPVWSARL